MERLIGRNCHLPVKSHVALPQVWREAQLSCGKKVIRTAITLLPNDPFGLLLSRLRVTGALILNLAWTSAVALG